MSDELPWWLSNKKSACQCRRLRFDSWVGKIPWRRERPPTPVFLPGKPHRQKSLEGYCPWGRIESDVTHRVEQLTLPLIKLEKKEIGQGGASLVTYC